MENKTKKITKKELYRTKWNFISTQEKNNGEVNTVQGESYTVQELLEKYAQGQTPAVQLTPLYDHDEPTFDDDITLRNPEDLTDVDELKRKVEDTQEQLKYEQEQKEIDAKEKALKKEADELAKKNDKKEPDSN